MPTKIICVTENNVKDGTTLRGEHGLAFWIETEHGTMLFDTGQTPSVFSHNLNVLNLSLWDIHTLALSHAHYDHTGGMDVLLSKKENLDIFANTDIFRQRYALRKGEYQSIGMAINRNEFDPCVKFHLSEVPQEIFPNLWTTGEIVERPELEGSSSHLFIHSDSGWQKDPYRDDMSLVLKTPRGFVLICGCCHAGILNTLFHVERVFGTPIISVIGGIHLVSAEDQYLDRVINIIKDRFPNLDFYLNHCSGEKTIEKFKYAFGNRLEKCPAGTMIEFG